MADMPVYLVEIDLLDPDGDPLTVCLATLGYNTKPGDTPPNRHYAERIADPGSFSQFLYGAGGTIGQSEPGYGEIVISNADGQMGWLLDCAMDGRPLRIKRLASQRAAFSSAVTVLAGKAEAPQSADMWRSISIGIYNRMLDLDAPLQSERYAGTTVTADGSYEGNEDLKETVKPLVFGRVRNIEPPLVNAHQWLYQVSASAVSSIVAYDGGSPRNPAGDFPSVAAALSASALYGRVATCNAQGIARFVGNAGAQPRYSFTTDVTEGGTLAARYPGAIARRMLAKAAVDSGDIDTAAFDALDTAAPWEAGIHIDSDEKRLSAISRLLASAGAYLIPTALGVFTTGLLAFGTRVATYDIDDPEKANAAGITLNPDSANGVPPWRIVVQYQPVYRVLDKSNVAGCVDAETKAFLATEWREVADEDTALRALHPRSEELVFQTLLDKTADAQAYLAYLRALYGVDRVLTSIRVPYDEAAAIGSTVTLQIPRQFFATGRDMIVISREDDFGDDMVTMGLWG
ncbi:MAG: hypothetical protein M9944_08075 [Rhizobiaceae bacterium]|nr:hypothetical protein [Rhizobiaceae bacterium]